MHNATYPLFDPRIRQKPPKKNNEDLRANNISRNQDVLDKNAEGKLLDEVVPFINKDEEKKNNYCFPRYPDCVSYKFIELMNHFGNEGGFEEILKALETKEPKEKTFSMKTISYLTIMISMLSSLFHFDWMIQDDFEDEDDFIMQATQKNEMRGPGNGPRYAKLIENQLKNAPDALLKTLDVQDIEQMSASIF